MQTRDLQALFRLCDAADKGPILAHGSVTPGRFARAPETIRAPRRPRAGSPGSDKPGTCATEPLCGCPRPPPYNIFGSGHCLSSMCPPLSPCCAGSNLWMFVCRVGIFTSRVLKGSHLAPVGSGESSRGTLEWRGKRAAAWATCCRKDCEILSSGRSAGCRETSVPGKRSFEVRIRARGFRKGALLARLVGGPSGAGREGGAVQRPGEWGFSLSKFFPGRSGWGTRVSADLRPGTGPRL